MKNLNSLLIRISIALVIAILLSLIFLHRETPYTAEIIKRRPHTLENQVYYFDIDGNGFTEWVIQKQTSPAQTSLVVIDENSQTIDQHNFRGSVIENTQLFEGDYNEDSSKELYLFTYIGDSLFLNIVDPYNFDKPIVARRYIEGCIALDGEAMYRVDGSAMDDSNNDGSKEFYFAIGAGYTLQPRAIYSYDIKNDVLESSALAGTAPKYEFYSYDIDEDGSKEFWGHSNAVGNYKEAIPYSDNSAWLMIYSTDLEYVFEPVEFPGYTSVLITDILQHNDSIKLVCLRKYSGSLDTIYNEICIFDIKGSLERKTRTIDFGMERTNKFYVFDGFIYLQNPFGGIAKLDPDLNLVKYFAKNWTAGSMHGPINLTSGKDKQVLFRTPTGQVVLTTPELKILATMELDDISQILIEPVFVSRDEMEAGFALKTVDFEYLISFKHNRARHLVFLYSVLMFVMVYFIIYFIQFLQLKQIEKKQEIENRLRTLQLQSAKSQMNPHFIFNALNSISSMYIKGDTERADSFLSSFSKMIREVVDSSDRIIIDLAEEIRFVNNYLELEQVRHGKKLSFSLDIPDECADLKVPSMCIHTFVENSIKHGFPGKDRTMHISIEALCNSGISTIYVKDSGIGFNKSGKDKGREGKGLKMIQEIFDSFYAITRKRISYDIEDLGDTSEGKMTGSLVKIDIKS